MKAKGTLKQVQMPEHFKSSKSFQLRVLGQVVDCSYNPSYKIVGHLEFHGNVSETGYKSFFFYFQEEHETTTVEDYAAIIAESFVAETLKSVPKIKANQFQLSLF